MSRVYRILSVDIKLLKSFPPVLAISALGQVSSSGWTNPQLSPWIYITPPADGIYDFDFIATPPTEISLPAFFPIAAVATWPDPPTGLKGVRIHATSNAMEALFCDDCSIDFPDANAKVCGDGVTPWPRK
jgi:hypothetical protein